MLTSRFMTSVVRSDAISTPPTACKRTALCALLLIPYFEVLDCNLAVPSRGQEDDKALPLPTKPRAKQWKASLREVRSFFIELMTSLRNSSFCCTGGAVRNSQEDESAVKQSKFEMELASFRRMAQAMYPTCFSAYLVKYETS